MFHKMPLVLIIIILAVILLDPILPFTLKQILYSISLSLKAIIILLLPFIIFSLLFKAVVILSNSATKVIGIIIGLVCFSNFIATFLSHYVGEWIYHFNLSMIAPEGTDGLTSLWLIEFPQLISNDKALFAGILLGLITYKLQPEKAITIARSIDRFISNVLEKFVYLIPVFVIGFIVKLQYDGVVGVILKDYTVIFILIALVQFCYIFLAYFLLSKCCLESFLINIKNMFPAAISGFITMSSAASMPFTLMGAGSNAKNKDIVASVIPATVNIHLIGDCFAIPILAYAVLKSFGMAEPSLFDFLLFAFYFIISKFSVAAIPSGGILVMLPILESYLGFDAEMMSFITALYILFDPVVTSANVLGNGAFAKMIDTLFIYIDRKPSRNNSTISD